MRALLDEVLVAFKQKSLVSSLLILLGASLSLATFFQAALAKRGYGHLLSLRLIILELAFLLVLGFIWLTVSLFFAKAGSLELAEVLKWDAVSLLPLLVLFLGLPLMSLNFLNLEKPLLLLGIGGSFALKWIVFRSRLNLKAALNQEPIKTSGALLFLALLGLLFFWRIISNSPLHQGSLAEDFNLFFPFRFFAAISLRKGIIPLWNPYVFSGTPFVADSQAAVFYPVNLFLTLLATPSYLSYKAAEWAVVIHFVLAALFMYLYARTIKLSSFGAIVSAVVFAFGGAMVSHVRHLPVLNVVVWLPLILMFLERGFASGKLFYAVPAGLAMGASILGGHLQMVLYVFYAVLVYGLFKIYALYREERKARRLWWAGVFLLALYVVAFFTTAMQTFPTLELLPQSNRSIDVSYGLTTDFSLEAQSLIMLLIPNFFGGISGRYWGPWSYWWEMCGYTGILPLILAAIAVLLVKRREVKFFGAAVLVSLLLVLGEYTFLHPLTYLILPGFSLNRAPSRLLYLFGFSLAVLAGFGADLLAENRTRLREDFLPRLQRFLLWLGASFVPLGLLSYYGLASNSSNGVKYQVFSNIVNGFNFFVLLLAFSIAVFYLMRKGIKGAALKSLVVGLIIFDLFSFGWQWYVEEKKPQEYYSADPVVEFLKKDKEFFRVANDDILSPNAGSVYGISTTSGSNPLSLKDYESISSREDLLNVKYVLSKKNLDPGEYTLVFSEGERKVFQRKHFVPRAFVPSRVLSAGNDDLRQIDELGTGRLALIEELDSLSNRPKGENRGTAVIVKHEPNEITLKADMEKGGFVVLSEIFYPGWKAYVDGRSTQVYRANQLLRAVFVPQGTHQVRLAFQPATYAWGLRVAGLSWLIIALIAGFSAARYFNVRGKKDV